MSRASLDELTDLVAPHTRITQFIITELSFIVYKREVGCYTVLYERYHIPPNGSKLAVTLYYMKDITSLQMVANTFGIARVTVGKKIKEVT